MKKFDSDTLMSDETGTRAIWWLYKHGMWGFLEDFGLARETLEPALTQFDAENVVKHRLTDVQARKLARLVPELAGASVELRLTYALRFYDEGKKKEKKKHMYRYYHGPVETGNLLDSDGRGEELAGEHADTILKAGGTVALGRNFGDAPAILIVSLPDDPRFTIDDLNRLIQGVTFQEVAFRAAPAVPDNGIPSDSEVLSDTPEGD